MSPVLASTANPDALDPVLGLVPAWFASLNDSSPLSLVEVASSSLASTSPSSLDHTLAKRLSHEAAIVVAHQSARQKAATLSFVLAYQWIIVSLVGILTVRHVVHLLKMNNRKWRLVLEKLDELHMEKLGRRGDLKGFDRLGHRAPWSAKCDAVLFYPFRTRWALGLENPLQLFLAVASFAINVGFVLAVSLEWDRHSPSTSTWNTIHVVALRCGFMSLAQLPAVIALTGRNSLVQFLTGIEYQHLRFAHKLLAMWTTILGVIHTFDATFANFKYFGGNGVDKLYLHNYLGQTGIVMIVGLFLCVAFAFVRRRCYEVFLVSHVVGAIMMLVGIILHVPALKVWLYVPIAFWVFERLARLVQLVSIDLLTRFEFRAPLVKARATSIEGAVVLRVPYKGKWQAGQHAYLKFLDPSLIRSPQTYLQSHPFSISNVPSCSEPDDEGRHDMLFVMRTRKGMTKVLAERLAASPTGAADLWMTVEGPYGGSIDTEQFHEILLVAGGAGISHVMSLLADILHKARTSYACAKRVKVIWTVQNIEQSIWTLSELLNSAKTAFEAGVELQIELYVSRGMAAPSPQTVDLLVKELPPPPHLEQRRASMASEEWDELSKESPIADALSILGGRPALDKIVPRFVAAAEGKSLVVACGPSSMAAAVRYEVTKLISTYPVSLEIALFEC
ncbi:hypothetical protein JCM10212_000875 [Sporobolomyces blumeae]